MDPERIGDSMAVHMTAGFAGLGPTAVALADFAPGSVGVWAPGPGTPGLAALVRMASFADWV